MLSGLGGTRSCKNNTEKGKVTFQCSVKKIFLFFHLGFSTIGPFYIYSFATESSRFALGAWKPQMGVETQLLTCDQGPSKYHALPSFLQHAASCRKGLLVSSFSPPEDALCWQPGPDFTPTASAKCFLQTCFSCFALHSCTSVRGYLNSSLVAHRVNAALIYIV